MNIQQLFSVAGKTVVVTGGSSGLGLMMAEGLLCAGASRVYISGRKGDQLRQAQQKLQNFGEVQTVQCDLTTTEGRTTLIDTLKAREEKLHVLVNNAGKSWGAPFAEYPDSAWEQLMALNVQAPFVLSQQLLPLLEKATNDEDPARIINIGSIGAYATGDLNSYAYSASKAAVHRLTYSLARELAPKNILVNAIAPGVFPSKMSGHILKDEYKRNLLVGSIPLGRIGKPEDIAALAVYLSSPASSFMTGSIITLDGGALIGGKA